MKSTAIGSTSTKVAKILLTIGAVLFSRTRPFKFDSGILSPVYVDNRILISYPKLRKKVVSALVLKIKNDIGVPDVVAGVATAGIPHAAWIAEALNLPMVFVRSKPKDHGRGNQVEGVIKKGQKVLVIEDLISTASSSTAVAKALRKMGAKVSNILAIYTHGIKDSQKNLKKDKLKLHYLTSTSEVADVAEKEGSLTKSQIDLISEWIKDPKTWAKRVGIQ